jgi:anti-anti-sigma factor
MPVPSSFNGEEIVMTAAARAFEVELDGQTLIVTPVRDLRELGFLDLEAGAQEVLHLLESGKFKNVVLDFHKTDYYGSTALAFFVKVWKRVKDCNGRMAFCGLSPHEREVLEVTRLAGLWPICSSRETALEAVRS